MYVYTAPVRSQHVAPRCTLRNSRPRLLPRLPLPIPTHLKLALLTRAPACSRLRPRCCCCCCCCRPAVVGTPYERRQNGWLHAETAGDCKRRCRIVTNRIKFAVVQYVRFFLGRKMFNPMWSVYLVPRVHAPLQYGAVWSGLAISANTPPPLSHYRGTVGVCD